MSINIQKVWVTRAEARALLELNQHNRNLSKRLVNRYKEDMDAGKWNEDTVEPLKISSEMILLDGQTRLAALVASTRPGLHFWIAYGVPPEAQEFMDQGKSRSARDVLTLKYPNLQDTFILSSLCRWVARIPELGVDPTSFAVQLAHGATVPQVIGVYESDPYYLQEAATRGAEIYNTQAIGTPTALAYSWYQIDRADRGAAAEFFGAIRNLSFHHGKDSRRATYEQCRRVARNPEISSASKTTAMIYVTLFTRGYNAWAEGRELDIIRYRDKSQLLEPVAPITRKVVE